MSSPYPQADPHQAPLPDAWPDSVQWLRPRELLRLWRKLTSRKCGRVHLPANAPGAADLPSYLLLEFHNMPNGYYSRCITRGYVSGFDRAMLGTLRAGRQRIAQALRGAQCALDLGSGGGQLAATLHASGVKEVWGLEPSPYLLHLGASAYPQVRWHQGVGENSGLPTAQFDAVGVCFVFHEIPPGHLRRLCAELRRITRPGARLAVLEPSPLQWRRSVWQMWKSHGWRGVYFRLLALRVWEPYADAWHRLDFAALLAEHGFTVEQDEIGCPFRFIVAQRPAL
jgi:SAM-dependent methyltransferase